MTDPRLELRRDAPADLGDVGEDVDLVERIRDEIRRHGPMSFARFMDVALYDPTGGYYRSAAARPGRSGDFITAPELHPIFGATLAAGIVEAWERLGRPDPFVVREHGAGEGALALAMLPHLPPGTRYQPIEVDERRIATLRSRLADAGLDAMLAGAGDPGEPADEVIVANEVLDALPVHRVRQRGDGLVELAVGIDTTGALQEVEVAPTTPALAERLAREGIELVDGQTAEICLALDDWVAAAVRPLARGLLVLIDYGAPATELYDPVRRHDGTLRAYVRHQVHADPFRHVGRQDLTAHVDVSAVEAAARAAGLRPVGSTTQAAALMGLGIEGRLRAIQADPATTMEAYLAVRSAIVRLIDPAAMGRFRVLAYGRDWPDPDEPLAMFAYRPPGSRG